MATFRTGCDAAADQEERPLGLDLLALDADGGRLPFPAAALHVAEEVDLFRGPLGPAERRDGFASARRGSRSIAGSLAGSGSSSLAWSRLRGDFGPAATARSVQVTTCTVEFGGRSSMTRRAASLARSSRVLAPFAGVHAVREVDDEDGIDRVAALAGRALRTHDRPGQGERQQEQEQDAEQKQDSSWKRSRRLVCSTARRRNFIAAQGTVR